MRLSNTERKIDKVVVQQTEKQEVTDMLDEVRRQLSVEFEDIYTSDPHRTPDRELIFAILERAVMDLFITEKDRANGHYRSTAIRWFLSPAMVVPDGFSFLQVAQNLNLSDRTVNKLITLVRSIQRRKGKYYELYTRYRSRRNRGICCPN